MKPELLVVTTVHPADDPRIREKLIGSLSGSFVIRYLSRTPGPSDETGLAWTPLRGPRLARILRALWIALRRPGAVLSCHDPELLPVALLVRLFRRVEVVFDVHENVPAQIQTKSWIPRPLRPVLAAGARFTLRIAERVMRITLAEWSYAGLFRGHHPVFPNYPLAGSLPPVASTTNGTVVYVGDVTEQRGARTLVEALGRLVEAPPLVLIGRCRPELADELRTLAREGGVDLELTGWLPHREAMARVAQCRLGLVPLHDIPNYRMSMPTKLLEYLALGVPVVASNLPGTRDIAHGLTAVRYASPGDVASLAGAIEYALADPADLEAARLQAHEVRARFAWPEAEVRRFYEGLVET